jgi:glycosyltransferase involved in cell wall biosynthesis
VNTQESFSISILIRTFNSAKTLERVIQGLGLSSGDEVVVVDSGSHDTTLTIAQKHGAKIIHAAGPFNYSKSLNLGFAAARNPWVLVLSSHSIPLVPDFLEVHRAAMRQFPDNVAVGYAPSTISAKIYEEAKVGEVWFYTSQTYKSIEERCGNGNAIYRRSSWQALPFDEVIRTAEDKLWLREYLQRGGEMAFIPAARTLNCNQASLEYMFRKGYSDARARCEKASEPAHYRPMRLYDLVGAQKKLLVQKLTGETGFANWLRYSAHVFGQFFGSRQKQDNLVEGKKIDTTRK